MNVNLLRIHKFLSALMLLSFCSAILPVFAQEDEEVEEDAAAAAITQSFPTAVAQERAALIQGVRPIPVAAVSKTQEELDLEHEITEKKALMKANVEHLSLGQYSPDSVITGQGPRLGPEGA